MDLARLKALSHVCSGETVQKHYDSPIGKLIIRGAIRAEAVLRMRTAPAETVVEGIATNLPLHGLLLDDDAGVRSGTDIHHLEHDLAGRHG